MDSYLIASGWWCTENEERESRFIQGEDYIRSKYFHNLWSQAIETYSSPSQVVIIDSASPVKGDWRTDLLPLNIIELDKNLGHATNLKNSKYCGWSASVLMSIEYFLLSDLDYYVYIEQDALIFGDGIIEKGIENLKKSGSSFAFGNSFNNIQPLEQSFFILSRQKAETFLTNYKRLKYNDAQMSPEIKFALSASSLYPFLPKWLFTQSTSTFGKAKRRLYTQFLKKTRSYDFLPFGHGRRKPVTFDEDFFYFQHGSKEEIEAYIELTGFSK